MNTNEPKQQQVLRPLKAACPVGHDVQQEFRFLEGNNTEYREKKVLLLNLFIYKQGYLRICSQIIVYMGLE